MCLNDVFATEWINVCNTFPLFAMSTAVLRLNLATNSNLANLLATKKTMAIFENLHVFILKQFDYLVWVCCYITIIITLRGGQPQQEALKVIVEPKNIIHQRNLYHIYQRTIIILWTMHNQSILFSIKRFSSILLDAIKWHPALFGENEYHLKKYSLIFTFTFIHLYFLFIYFQAI